jgi:hypothetical protein
MMPRPRPRARIRRTSKHLPSVDGRTIWAKRRKALLQALTAQWQPTNQIEHVMVANVVDAIVRSEQMAIDVAKGTVHGHAQDEERTRLSHL